jgi:hypothetical protein
MTVTLAEVTTPQFRTLLVRKFKNILPNVQVEFVDGCERGIGFWLRDRRGRIHSKAIRIYRNHRDTLSRENLLRLLYQVK